MQCADLLAIQHSLLYGCSVLCYTVLQVDENPVKYDRKCYEDVIAKHFEEFPIKDKELMAEVLATLPDDMMKNEPVEVI
jgi:hypothetical protein